jgi:hypothetical protein
MLRDGIMTMMMNHGGQAAASHGQVRAESASHAQHSKYSLY